RHAQLLQLGPVGVEPTRERLVGHLGVALDARLDVAGGERAPLGHQEGDERELADQLVGVVTHRWRAYRARPVEKLSATMDYVRRRRGFAAPTLAPRVRSASATTNRARCEATRRRASRGAGATGSSRVRATACAGTAFPCASSPGSARRPRRALRPRSAPR